MKISKGVIDHDNSFIEIKIKDDIYSNIKKSSETNILLKQIENIQCFISARIGSSTIIEYHTPYPYGNVIKLPIKIYTEEQRRKTIKDLLNEKFKSITDLCNNFKDSDFRISTKWFFRCVNKSLNKIKYMLQGR